jgi:hypothetical protein
LDTVFETVELPAGIANLDTGLADVDGDNFTHFCLVAKERGKTSVNGKAWMLEEPE